MAATELIEFPQGLELPRLKLLLGGWLACVAAALIFLIGAAMIYQAKVLHNYEKKWAAMEPDVNRVQSIQDKLRKYRPWNEEDILSLSVLKDMTEVFPEEGISIRSVDMNNMSEYRFSGEARSGSVWLEMLGRLRQKDTLTDVRVSSVKQGDDALQFTVIFSR